MSYKNLSAKKYYSRYSSGLFSKRADFTMRSVISPVFESLTLGELGIPKIKISYWTPKKHISLYSTLRENIKTTLLCAGRFEIELPNEIWLEIFAFIRIDGY